MSDYLISNSNGFEFGYTAITQIGEMQNDTGINFGILKLKAGEQFTVCKKLESAHLLINGKCQINHSDTKKIIERASCFDEDPVAVHAAANNSVIITAITDAEFAVSEVENSLPFETKIFTNENMLESEKRGIGLLNNTSCRIVRTIFDSRNRPQAKLVLGEVVTAPGRWSSYPPHHHIQPEIYHYRFTESQGYGHAECGDHVFKVKQFDTYKILNQKDHAQVAAPGYGMYYIWVIRHLEEEIYKLPHFVEEHNWTRTEEANSRVWECDF